MQLHKPDIHWNICLKSNYFMWRRLYMKLKSLNKSLGDSRELSLESFEYPLTDFEGDIGRFGLLHSIKFDFSKADQGVVIIDNLGFSAPLIPLW